MIVKDVALVLKGVARRRLEVPCMMLISRSVSERQATPSSMIAKATPTSGWRTKTSRVERAE
jgi:hypothetical protein